MRRPRYRVLLSLLLGSCLAVAASPASAAAAPAGPPSGPPPPSTRTGAIPPAEVTLITGDKVFVQQQPGGQPRATILPRDGSHSDGFGTYLRNGDLYVQPHSVDALVPSVLDPDLFNVSALVRMGYDDAHSAALPLIVQQSAGTRAAGTVHNGLVRGRALASVHGYAARLPHGAAATFGAKLRAGAGSDAERATTVRAALGGVQHVWLDRRVSAAEVDANLTQIGAPTAWQAGLSGAGIKVAVLDTGIDASHPDLAGQVVASAAFDGSPDAVDHHGHGTHVASLIAGTGAASDGARRGVAYGAKLVVGKVLDDNAEGSESDIIAGMQWAVAQGSRVVNMSLGGLVQNTDDDPMVRALQDLSASSGALFVVAAGNSGPSNGTIEVPGAAPAALTVGAVDSQDRMVFFSSRGPTAGPNRLKPDITAPGVNIIGARAGGGTTDPYTTISGTSQATPQVAGAAALLMQQHPDWTGQQVKAALMVTATPGVGATAYDQGAGRLDLTQAISAPLLADPPAADLGFLRWPDRAPRSRTITLSNLGDAPRTVHLSDTETQGGAPVADAMVTVTPADLTIPAHGSATATVVLDPAADSDPGLYSGAVTVTADGTTLAHLPLAFSIESEHYDLHVSVLDLHGEPYAGGSVMVANLNRIDAGSSLAVPLDEHGQVTLRLAPGAYALASQVTTPGLDGAPSTLAFTVAPQTDLHADASVTLDARRTVPLRAPTVAGDHTYPEGAGVQLLFKDDKGSGVGTENFFWGADVKAGRVRVQPAAPVTVGKFVYITRWRLDSNPSPANRPDREYNLIQQHNQIPPSLVDDLSSKDVANLARIDTSYRSLWGPTTATEWGSGWNKEENTSIGFPRQMPLPTKRIEYATAGPDVYWQHHMWLPAPADVEMFDQPRTYRPGERAVARWFSPLSGAPVGVWRSDDFFYVVLGLGDGEHSGSVDDNVATARVSLSRNGELIGTWEAGFGYFTIPTGPARFTIEQDQQVKDDRFASPRQTHTTWSFEVDPPDPAVGGGVVPPMVTLSYAPKLDDYGLAAPGRPLRFELSASHLVGAAGPVASITGATLEYSVDGGATWHPLKLDDRGGGSYRTTIPGAALRPGQAVSVRATARDADGGTIEQTTIGLFRVAGTA